MCHNYMPNLHFEIGFIKIFRALQTRFQFGFITVNIWVWLYQKLYLRLIYYNVWLYLSLIISGLDQKIWDEIYFESRDNKLFIVISDHIWEPSWGYSERASFVMSFPWSRQEVKKLIGKNAYFLPSNLCIPKSDFAKYAFCSMPQSEKILNMICYAVEVHCTSLLERDLSSISQ